MRCEVDTCFVRPRLVSNHRSCIRYENNNDSRYPEKITASSQMPLQQPPTLKRHGPHEERQQIGTNISHGQNPDIAECTCLTRPGRKERFLLCLTRTNATTDCPIHSSKDSTGGQDPTPTENQTQTTRQTDFARRIGRWIVKKVTKDQKAEQFSYKLLDSRSETDCKDIEPEPELQIRGKLDLGLYGSEEYAPAGTTTDNCIEPDSIDVATAADVNKETGGKMVMSLKDMCIEVADRIGSTVNKKAKSNRKKKDTTRLRGLVRRIGQWIMKQVTKRRAEEQFAYKPLESRSVSVCIELEEQPELQIICHVDISEKEPKDYTCARTDIANCVEPGGIDVNTANDVNRETGRRMVISLKDLCKAVLGSAGSISKGKNDSKKDSALYVAQCTGKKPELDHEDINSEYKQRSVISLRELCKAVVKYPDDTEYDHTEKQEPEQENTSLSSKFENSATMTLVELCKNVIRVDGNNTNDVDARNRTIDVTIYTKGGNPEYDTRKLMSLKDICTAIIKRSGAKTIDMIDTYINGSKTADINESKDDIANDETQSMMNNTDYEKKPESYPITVISLKDICKAALTYPVNQRQSESDTKPVTHDTNNPEQDKTSLSSKFENNATTTPDKLCKNGISRVDGMNMNDVEVTHRTIDVTIYTKGGNPEYDSRKLMSLKDMCTAIIKRSGARTIDVTETYTNGSQTADINESKDDIANDETQSMMNNTDYEKKPESYPITVISLKDICKAALTYLDNQRQSESDTKTVTHDIINPEQDNTNLSSKFENNAPMTLDNLCKNGISRDGKNKNDVDAKNRTIDVTVYTKGGNPEYDSRKLMSLKDMCTAIIKRSSAKTINMIDTYINGSQTADINESKDTYINGSKTADINESKDDIANDETQSMMNNTDYEKKPESYPITVISLKDICKAALTYPVNQRQSESDTKTVTHDTNNPEQDKTSLSSKSKNNATTTLDKLCRNGISSVDGMNTNDVDVTDRTIDVIIYTKGGNPEYDSRKLMSLKDICTAVIKRSGAKTIEVIDTYTNGSQTADINESKDDIANDETQSMMNNTDYEKKPESYPITVISLKDICKAALTYPVNQRQSESDTKTVTHDIINPEQDNTNLSSKFENNAPMTLDNLCKNGSSRDGKNTNDIDAKNRTIDVTVYTKGGNPEYDSRKSMSLKDMCTAIIKRSSDRTKDMIDTYTNGSKTADINESKDDIANDETQSMMNNTDYEKKSESYPITVISLKDICKAALTYPDNQRQSESDAKTVTHDTNNPEQDNSGLSSKFENNVPMTLVKHCKNGISRVGKNTNDVDVTDRTIDVTIYTKGGNPEYDSRKLMSLKDMCTAIIKRSGAKRINVIDTYTSGSQTADINESKGDIANDETQSMMNNTVYEKKPESYPITVISLKDICKAALTYPVNLTQIESDTKTDNSKKRNGDDKGDPEVDNISLSAKVDWRFLMTTDNFKQEIVKEESQPNVSNSELSNGDKKSNRAQITVKSFKETCAAVVLSDDLRHNTVDTNTKERYINFKTDPELDKTSTNSGTDVGMLMTLVQLCTRVVSNTDKKNTEANDMQNAVDDKINTIDVNFKYGANIVISLKDICTEAIKTAYIKSMSVIDGYNTTDISDSIQGFAYENIQYIEKMKMHKTEMKPEHYQTEKMSATRTCKAAITCSDNMKHPIDESKSYYRIDQHNHERNHTELDNESTSSEYEDSVLIFMVQLFTNIDTNNDDDDKKTSKKERNDNTNDDSLCKNYIQHEYATKGDSDSNLDKYDIMIATLNKTIDAARVMAAGAGEGYRTLRKIDKYESVMASEDRDNQELFLPVETHFQQNVDKYNKRRCRTKIKLRNKVRLQRETHYQINMDEEIAAAEQLTDNDNTLTDNVHTITDNLHRLTLTDNGHKLPIVDEEGTRRRKMLKYRQVSSHGRGKANKDRKKDNGVRSHNIRELGIGVKPKLNLRNIENVNKVLEATKKQHDDFIYNPQTTKKSIASKTADGISGLDDRHQEVERRRRGDEAGSCPGNEKDIVKGAEISSKSHVEQNLGSETDPLKVSEFTPESYVKQNFDATAEARLTGETADGGYINHRQNLHYTKV